jgi:hypothetical protein
MLEAGASKTLFPCDNKVNLERNATCQSGFSSGRKAHFAKNRPIQLN